MILPFSKLTFYSDFWKKKKLYNKYLAINVFLFCFKTGNVNDPTQQMNSVPQTTNLLVPLNEFLQMFPSNGQGIIFPQTSPPAVVPSIPPNMIRTFFLPGQDPKVNGLSQPQQILFQNVTQGTLTYIYQVQTLKG